MLGENRLPLAAALHAGLASGEPDAAEIERREAVKSALLAALVLADRGELAAIIITQLKPGWPPQYVTEMIGEREIIQMSAAQVVMKYAGKKREENAVLTVSDGEILAGS